MVVPVAQDPVNNNAIIVYDLRYDPDVLNELDAEAIRERLFTAKDDLPEGVERLPMKAVHINKCPVLVPLGAMDNAAAERLQIDREQQMRHLEKLRAIDGLAEKIQQAYSQKTYEPEDDPDLQIYSGGFFSNEDRRRMEQIRKTPPAELAAIGMPFDDARIPEMLFRYRARNYPQTLTPAEQQRWQEFRGRRLAGTAPGNSIILDDYKAELDRMLNDDSLTDPQCEVLRELKTYGETIL
jgi:exodeoxyribonuclease-1